MREPRIHHFVSQVLIKKFLGPDKMLYTYSKRFSTVTEKPYERFDFAEEYLNSIIDDNGIMDNSSVEENLNRHFETGFNKHYKILKKALEGGEYNLITPSIKYLIRMGIIGDMRTPQHLEETNLSILGALKNIFDIATDELKEDISILESCASKVQNKIPVDYNEICNKILELMGESIYSVFQAPDGHYFFLPDNSSITMRSQLEPDANVNGERLINPSRPISTIIFPIDSKTIIVAQSSKICPQKNNGIYQFSAKSVIDYNMIFIDNCREKVICENKTYLESFIAEHIKI